MKKIRIRIYLLITIGILNIISVTPSIAQSYQPWPGVGSFWRILSYSDFPFCLSEYFYRYDKDSMMGGFNYMVYSKLVNYDECNPYPVYYSDFALLREDSINERIYCQIPTLGITSDSLLYNFSLVPGDTLPLGIINPDTLPVYVDYIDSVFIKNNYYKVIHFVDTNSAFVAPVPIVQGAGNFHGLIEGIARQNNQIQNNLACLIIAPDTIATYFPNVTTCYYPVIPGIPIIDSYDAIKIFPQPGGNTLNLQGYFLLNNKYEIKIYDSLGRIIKFKSDKKEDGTVQINLDANYSGVLYLQIMTQNKIFSLKAIVFNP